MAAGNNITISLNLNDNNFKKGINNAGSALQKLVGVEKFVKLKLDDNDFRKQYQATLGSALKEMKKVGALSYKASNGKVVNVDDTKSAIKAYSRYLELANSATSTKEQNAYIRKANAVGQYIQALSTLGNKLDETARLEQRLQRARNTAAVEYAKKSAYKQLVSPEKEQKAADRRFRAKQMIGLRMQDAADAAELKRQQAEEAARNKRAAANRAEYDRQIKAGTDTRTPELSLLRSYYQDRERRSAADEKELSRLIAQENREAEQRMKAQIANQERLAKEAKLAAQQRAKAEAEAAARSKKTQHEVANAYGYNHSQSIKYREQQDRLMNSMSYGNGNSNPVLGSMRNFYQQQEREADKAAQQQAAEQARLAREAEQRAKQQAAEQARQAKEQERQAKAAERERQKQLRAQQKAQAQLEKQGGVLTRLKGLATSYLSVFTAFRYIKDIVETTGYFEQQQVALEGILGSASAATKAISQLKSMALQSPKQFKDLVGDAKQLSAYGIEAKDLLTTVKQLADISVGLGVDMGRLTLAYGQVKSATVLRGQELRQFTEAGVPMVQALAEKFTQLNGKLVTTSEIFDLISKRQVSFEMVSDVLKDMTAEGGKFYNMQENISETLYGQVQKIKDLWTINLNDTGSSISGILMTGVKAIQAMIKESRTLLWIFGAAGILVGIRSIVTSFSAIKLRLGEVRTATSQWVAWIKAASGAAKKAGVIFKGIGKALMSNIGIAAMSALVGVIARAVIKAKEFNKELDKIMSSSAKDTAKYVQGFDSLIGKLSTLTEGTKKYNEALDTLKANYGDYVNPAIIDQLIAERKQLDNTAEGWGKLHDSIVAAIQARKDYEMHEALKEKAGEAASENFLDSTLPKVEKALENWLSSAALATQDPQRREALVDASMKMYDNNTGKNALRFAIESFFGAGETTQEELKKRVTDSFQRYGIPPEAIKDITSTAAFSTIWSELSKTDEFKKYLQENQILKNDDYAKITEAFNNAKKKTNERQEGRWQEGMSNADYNPIKLIEAGQFDISKAISSLVVGLSKDVKDKIASGVSKDDIFTDGADGVSKYNEAIRAFNQELNGMTVNDFKDAEKVNRVAQAIHNIMQTISDPNLRNRLGEIEKQFAESAGVKTGQAAQVSTNIAKNLLSSGVLSHEEKDWYAKYIKQTNDESFESVREGIRKQYLENKAKIESYGATATGANKVEVDRLKAENERLKILAGEQYYDIDLTEKKGGGGGYKHNKEYDEFLNEFKSAYEMYKKAVQQGGLSMGAAFVQNNKKVQEMFGGFFNGGAFGDKFKQLKVGDKNVIDLIQDKFITDGVEKGIVDFKGAAESVAAQLKAESEKHKGTSKGQDYLQSYNALTKWIESTFSKDNLDGFLDELTKGLNDLTQSFEQTNKGIELYNKLIQQGTQGTIGATFNPLYAANATTPKSTIMMSNISKVVDEYNKALAQEAASNPDSDLAKSKNAAGLYTGFSIGNIIGIDDAYKELSHINELLEVNNDNFKSSESGKITVDVLKPMLEKLIQQSETEIASISGKQYTGNAMSDLIANSKIAYETARSANEAAQKIAQSQGIPVDYEAIKRFVEASSGESTAIFDQFLKDNDFTVMFDALNGMEHIDFGEMRKKLENIAKDFPPLLKQQLLDNLTDLESKIAGFNTGTGGRLFQNIRDYNSAGTRAQAKYNETVANGKAIAGDKFAMVNNQISLEGITNPEDIARLIDINKELDEMGENGEKLEVTFKKDALENIAKSAEVLSSKFNAMTDVVTSITDAFKAFANTLNKVYDVMNDGENPDWMVAMEEDINDFADAFSAIIAPIVAVIAVIGTLTVAASVLSAVLGTAFAPLMIAMGVIIGLAAVIAGVVAAIQHHDNELERSIERMKKEVEEFDKAVTNLNAAAERQTGLEKLGSTIEAIGLSLSKASEYAKMYSAEDAKKNTDYDKLKEYAQQQQEALDEFRNSLKSTIDDITKATEDWASSMGGAIRSAFQNGENAARAFRNTVKDMIGDVVENMLEMAVLQPLIENALEGWTNAKSLQAKYTYTDANGIQHLDSDNYQKELLQRLGAPNKAENFYNDMLSIGNTLIDVENGLPSFLQDALWNNSELQSLSGGIENITEDTARRLEALGNSQLGALLNIQSILQNYIGGNGMYGSSPMADIQTTIAIIQSDTTGIRMATQSLLSEIKSLRSSSVQPLHVSIV